MDQQSSFGRVRSSLDIQAKMSSRWLLRSSSGEKSGTGDKNLGES